MRRSDLVALTPDDLAALTNRGTVKRAQRELEAGEVTCEIREEAGGDLVFAWSDGITCRFPAGKSVHDAVCSSGVAGITRHVVRSVLAYQRAESDRPPAGQLADAQPADAETQPDVQAAETASSYVGGDVWDPGRITDDDLVSRFRSAAVTKARKRFEQGVLVELTRGAKPTARFLDEACTVRFLVPGDLRYVTADCAESLWPLWVPLAVWAFRELPAGQLAGLLCLQQADLPVPTAVLDELDRMLDEFCREGLSGLSAAWSARVSRLEQSLRAAGLVWPAELVLDLLHQHAMYQQHDARFEPQQLALLVGELIARTRAIASGTRAAPQLLIRGTPSDRPTEIAAGRLIGLGLGVRPGQRHATLSAYLQEVDSGSVVAVERSFADPEPQSSDSPRSFTDLAATVVARGVSLGALGSSQLLLKSGKRTPGGVLILPRTSGSLAVNPQSFQWEQLKPPLAAESFAQLAARFDALPPSYLRPRRRTENLHAVAVSGAENAAFDAAHQRLTAVLRDELGGTALLVHPFHTRGREGFGQLLTALQQRGSQARFVCGHVRSTGRTLEVQPISVIMDDGTRRFVLQPWLAGHVQAGEAIDEPAATGADDESPIGHFLQQLREQVSDLLLTGVNRGAATRWREQADLGRQLGFVRLVAPLADLAEAFESRANAIRWDAAPAVRQARALCLLARIAAE